MIDDEEVLEFTLKHSDKIRFQNIYNHKNDAGDPTDLQALVFACKSGKCEIFSCDRNLLMLCDDLNIQHFCFKAALVRLDRFSEGSVFDSAKYKTDPMFKNTDDPFFCFANNNRCSQCCKDGCEFQRP